MAIIREIQAEDNAAVATIIRSVLIELGVPKVGTAYEDPELNDMHKAYDNDRCVYYVIEEKGRIVGGAGIAPLVGADSGICELQKMYFDPVARGLGLGRQMIEQCLVFAKAQNFQLCYLETLPYMKAAQKLYRKVGFDYVNGPMGSTGHTSCNVWLTKSLLS